MYLLYTDASGTADLSDPNTKHYVLVGLAMHEGTWFALNKRLVHLKMAYCQTGYDFELHAAEFACSIKEQDEIAGFAELSWTDRRATVAALRQSKINAETTASGRQQRRDRYHRTEDFIHLTRLERSKLLEDALDLVGGHKGIVLFGEAIAKSHPSVTANLLDPVHQAFEQLVSRFDAYLRRLDEWKLKKGPRRHIDNGLLVLDQDYSTESAILGQFKNCNRSRVD